MDDRPDLVFDLDDLDLPRPRHTFTRAECSLGGWVTAVRRLVRALEASGDEAALALAKKTLCRLKRQRTRQK